MEKTSKLLVEFCKMHNLAHKEIVEAVYDIEKRLSEEKVRIFDLTVENVKLKTKIGKLEWKNKLMQAEVTAAKRLVDNTLNIRSRI